MAAPSSEDLQAVLSREDCNTSYADMAIHAQALDFDELNKLASLLPDDSTTTMEAPQSHSPRRNGNSDTEIDSDDILPEESFSTHPSPAGSQVNGKVYRKPPISIFQTDHSPDEPSKPRTTDIPTSVQVDSQGLPSPPETPGPQPDRTKDDAPGRYSDIEGTPPLRAAGFVGDEIPRIDPLDSDGEWAQLADLRKQQFHIAQTGEEDPSNLGVVEDKKKKRRRKKKSKGVCSPCTEFQANTSMGNVG